MESAALAEIQQLKALLGVIVGFTGAHLCAESQAN
jgi:hypothetical protein